MKKYRFGLLLCMLTLWAAACSQPQGVELQETAVTDTPTAATDLAVEVPTDVPTAESDPDKNVTEPPPTVVEETAVSTETAVATNPPPPTRTPDPELVAKYAEYELVTLLPPDAIPAIDNPRFLDVEQADAVYDPSELVIGVVFNGEARAYSVPLLSNHEIVNDDVGGVKIAVTW